MRRILILDRYPGICQSLSALLDPEHKITTVTSLEEAIGILKEYSFDLVIMDTRLRMPTRLELLRFINKHKPTPVVFTSIALAEIQELEKNCGYNADGHILKPFDNQEGKEMVDKLISV